MPAPKPSDSAVPSTGPGAIRLRGVRHHNLRGFDLDIPWGRLTVVTGVSGSGKSTLAFDTLYAEGQRRYVECLSSYARQFVERMDRPEVDDIRGILPAVALRQGKAIRAARATVGSLTECGELFRVVFAHASVPDCPRCGAAVRRASVAELANEALELATGRRAVVTFGLPVASVVAARVAALGLAEAGYHRAFVQGQVQDLAGLLERSEVGERVDVLQDRLVLDRAEEARLVDSLQQALRRGAGVVHLYVESDGPLPVARSWRPQPDGAAGRFAQWRASSALRCTACGTDVPEPSPQLFSAASAVGACPACNGFGRKTDIDLGRVIPDGKKTLRQGAIKPWSTESTTDERRDLAAFCDRRGIEMDTPWQDLPHEAQLAIVEGEKGKGSQRFYGIRGWFAWLETKTYKMHVRVLLARYRAYTPCPTCKGKRLRPEALAWKLAGRSLPDWQALPVAKAAELLAALTLGTTEALAVQQPLGDLRRRVEFLTEVGLPYLTLDRAARTLSGGELQRVQLVAALATGLSQVLYVLDEPSVGLHPRDNDRLLRILERLKLAGNTVVVVEHDPALMLAADQLVDLGPGSGEQGGALLYAGPAAGVLGHSGSLTGDYLAGRRVVDVAAHAQVADKPPPRRGPKPAGELRIVGATARNLRGTDVVLRKGQLNAVCGVSGSGKSTLMEEVLYRQLLRSRGEPVDEPGACAGIDGDDFREVVLVDQELPQGSSRANCATYLKVWDAIRARLANEPLAQARGYSEATFSFNREGGRCSVCEGLGLLTVEMQFLSDVRMTCEACGGARFRAEVLQVRHRGLDAAGFLARTAQEMAEQFADDPALAQPMQALCDLGLGYLRLGQPLSTLSGGEAQRLKIAWHLLQARTHNALFLLDEPSTGLHLHDVAILLGNLRRLLERGNTVVLVEHHLDLIAAADHVVELGPEGGPDGGHVLYQGPASGLLERDTPTARFLRQHKRGGVYQRTPGLADADPSVERDPGVIEVRGARVHNLRDVSVDVPRTGMTVVTGLSGSGKSSLAFDVVFAEGQRRFLDCLAPFARQYLPPATRPDVDRLAGLPPTVAIAQRTTRGGLRSTVGTLTDIYPYLRLLWARCGEQRCPTCGGPVSSQSQDDMAAAMQAKFGAAAATYVLAPAVRGRKGHHKEVLERARQLGHAFVHVDGSLVALDAVPPLRRFAAHDLDYVVARLTAADADAALWQSAVDAALALGDGTVLARTAGQPPQTFSLRRHCSQCDRSVEAPDPRLFTFTSSFGWCTSCEGTGVVQLGKGSDDPDAPAAKPKRGRPKKAETGDGKSTEDLQKAGLPDGGEEVPDEALRRLHTCPACDGSRLKPLASSVRLFGRTLPEAVCDGPGTLGRWLATQPWTKRQVPVAEPIVREVSERCAFLSKLGLDYLPLGRGAATLSGGESQRLRLAAQLASNLTGVLYVLDEPTIGLHPEDNRRVLDALGQLAARGNGLLVVEHDEETILRADHVLEMGPGGGRTGGQLVFAGSVPQLQEAQTATGQTLRHPHLRRVRPMPRDVPEELPGSDLPHLTLRGARRNNLRDLTVHIPRGRLTAVTGVSGSGKSTLIRDLLVVYGNQGVSVTDRRLGPAFTGNDELAGLEGLQELGRVVEVDQSPIGRTPRSTPATYMGIFDPIRQVFAGLPAAKVAGLGASAFSFNAEGGRCPTCGGAGTIKVQMSFLPTTFVPCDSCGGTRYQAHVLQVKYKGASIADVLAMSMQEAEAHFAAISSIHKVLALACKMGLGYLQLGQGSHTLSGGEAQRLKVVTELAKTRRKETLYVLDEPSTGLHLQDVTKLVAVLHELVDRGDTVVVIEHQMDLVAEADWLVDLGPGAGADGGQLLWQGSVDGLRQRGTGPTARALRGA